MENRIERQIEIKAPVSRVWQALTSHKEFGAWFRVNLDGPFVVGKETTGKITYPGYEGIVWKAVVQKMEPETYFSFTWPHDEHPNVSVKAETLVEFTLQKTATGTLLKVSESGFEKLPADKRSLLMRDNSEGWTIQMTNIEAYVKENP